MEEVEALEWVSSEQMDRLEGLSGQRGDWREWLPLAMDETWPDWVRSTPDELVRWLDDLLPSFEAVPDQEVLSVADQEFAVGETATDQGSVENLGWVTQDQRGLLEQVSGDRGDWWVWLPAALSELWTDWVRSTPDQLAQWLDELLPYFATTNNAAEEAAPIEEAVSIEAVPAGDTSHTDPQARSEVVELDPALEAAAIRMAEFLDRALAAQLELNPKLREIPEEQLRSVLREQLAEHLA
ncbi:hypothetical protein [Kribbella monticola]|uniref:hypothetical protein n=1 Tax=Kribbella monticola TaxID=2185285 RepID=UPI000DD41AAB|nr:hypothetical protein [Kribbella monticola]